MSAATPGPAVGRRGFIAALGTNRLSFLDHPFELNCFDTALLLAGPEMDVNVDLHSHNGPFLAVQVTTNWNQWLIPVASLGDVYTTACHAWYGASRRSMSSAAR